MAKDKTTTKPTKTETSAKHANLFAELAAETGGELLSELSKATYFIDTGNLAVNHACSGKYMGGGIPGGRVCEIFGPEASAKSYFGTNALFGTQKINGYAAILDVENAANPEWIERSSHIDIKKVFRYTPPSLERCFKQIYGLTKAIRKRDKKAPITVVYDSLSVSPSEREYQEMMLPENATDAQKKAAGVGKEQPGERAKACSRELRKLNTMMEAENATVFIINQLRKKIGVMYGDDTTTAGGGESLKYYASLRLKTFTTKQIKNEKLGTVVGAYLKLRAVKNRFFRPYAEVDKIELLFENGVNPMSGLLMSLVQAERVLPGTGGNYSVAKAYLPEGMEKRTFKASKESNKVPMEVILECPALVDAANKQEILEYLKPYGDIESKLSNPDLVTEDVVQDDDAALDAFFKDGEDGDDQDTLPEHLLDDIDAEVEAELQTIEA
jgi:RecA/RadA recombinase